MHSMQVGISHEWCFWLQNVLTLGGRAHHPGTSHEWYLWLLDLLALWWPGTWLRPLLPWPEPWLSPFRRPESVREAAACRIKEWKDVCAYACVELAKLSRIKGFLHNNLFPKPIFVGFSEKSTHTNSGFARALCSILKHLCAHTTFFKFTLQ